MEGIKAIVKVSFFKTSFPDYSVYKAPSDTVLALLQISGSDSGCSPLGYSKHLPFNRTPARLALLPSGTSDAPSTIGADNIRPDGGLPFIITALVRVAQT